MSVVFSVVLLLCRFNDIAPNARRTCVQLSQEFLVNHPSLVKDIAGSVLNIMLMLVQMTRGGNRWCQVI